VSHPDRSCRRRRAQPLRSQVIPGVRRSRPFLSTETGATSPQPGYHRRSTLPTVPVDGDGRNLSAARLSPAIDALGHFDRRRRVQPLRNQVTANVRPPRAFRTTETGVTSPRPGHHRPPIVLSHSQCIRMHVLLVRITCKFNSCVNKLSNKLCLNQYTGLASLALPPTPESWEPASQSVAFGIEKPLHII